MTSTVQATCPGCQNVLRIPGEWADRTMRCKKCGTLMQGKARSGVLPPAPMPAAAVPGADFVPQPLDPVPPSEQGFPVTEPVPTASRKYKRHGSGNQLIGYAIVIGLVGALVGGGYYMHLKMEKEATALKTVQLPGKEKDKEPGRDRSPLGKNDKYVVETSPKENPLLKAADPFPRRLLFIHLSNYIFMNPLSPGTAVSLDMPTKSAQQMARELRIPTDKENSQFFFLSDTADKKFFQPPVKSVLMNAFEQFFATSRDQDRIVVYFGGHAVLADGKAYLAPIEGEPDDAKTLMPLAEIYAKLAECKAQQKIVLWDVCRLDPDRGEERPGADKMSEELLKLFQAAPEGVQVAISCGANQNAQENSETGSEFLTAFRVMTERSRRTGKAAPVAAADPIPSASWLDGLKAYLADPRDKTSPQTVQLRVPELTKTVPYNKEEPLAKRFEWFSPPKGISEDTVIALLKEVNLPGIKADLSVPADLSKVYPFPENLMKAYAEDGITEEMIEKEPAKYPIRKAALDTLKAVNRVWVQGTAEKGGLMESFEGDVDDKVRKQIQDLQVPIAKINLELETAISELEALTKKLPEEKSKRWKAIFQYAQAQVLLRWAYMNEYVGALGKIRTDSLPRDDKGNRGAMKLVSIAKPSRKETTARLKEAQELLETMATDHKGTPYEVLAKLHKNVSVGLEWRVVVAEKKPEDPEMAMPKPDAK
ncbi:MAG: caspase family protein [Gemmataceae bacterium]